MLALMAGIPGLVVLWMMPVPLLYPALGVAALISAVGAAFLAWSFGSGRDTSHFNLWDAAGVYAFIGFAVGMTSKPDHIVQLFGLA